MAILSILAAMAAPYARKQFQREKELRLRETLRTVRTAIDRFHADWEAAGGEGGFASVASAEGYPLSLAILVDGVEKKDGKGDRKRYMRSLPTNPFAAAGTPFDEQWSFVRYQKAPALASSSYGRTLFETQRGSSGIYDLHAITTQIAIDGTRYAEW